MRSDQSTHQQQQTYIPFACVEHLTIRATHFYVRECECVCWCFGSSSFVRIAWHTRMTKTVLEIKTAAQCLIHVDRVFVCLCIASQVCAMYVQPMCLYVYVKYKQLWRGMSALIFSKHSVAAAAISNDLRYRQHNAHSIAPHRKQCCAWSDCFMRHLLVRYNEVMFNLLDQQTSIEWRIYVERFETYAVFRHTCPIHMINEYCANKNNN